MSWNIPVFKSKLASVRWMCGKFDAIALYKKKCMRLQGMDRLYHQPSLKATNVVYTFNQSYEIYRTVPVSLKWKMKVLKKSIEFFSKTPQRTKIRDFVDLIWLQSPIGRTVWHPVLLVLLRRAPGAQQNAPNCLLVRQIAAEIENPQIRKDRHFEISGGSIRSDHCITDGYLINDELPSCKLEKSARLGFFEERGPSMEAADSPNNNDAFTTRSTRINLNIQKKKNENEQ
ncbi:hypothetical protein Tcan_11715 [Toxocara canis]|uniref:Uncharacterized protein n=1 Tax=Toxocara canis TaxID=6265 RepID=A0A0B2UR64_TOXCA|nr:hypothetical protein Tcan_11715 [Toxocara canis]